MKILPTVCIIFLWREFVLCASEIGASSVTLKVGIKTHADKQNAVKCELLRRINPS